MLKARILTAVILLSVFILVLFFLPQSAWVGFASLIAAVAAWEWGAMMSLDGWLRRLLALGMALLCLLMVFFQPSALGLAPGFSDSAWALGQWFYIPALVFWMFGVPLWMKRRWILPKSLMGLLVGMVLILPTWLALVQLKLAGALPLIAIMAIVWVSDSAAYFFGKSFGRHKLAPSISPGKTWEGAVGGGAAVIVYGFLLSSNLPEVFPRHDLLLLFVLLVLTVFGIVGDLFESLLKRQAGLKDSSNVLPGHGGVLDRIDSLTSTLPLVALVWLVAKL